MENSNIAFGQATGTVELDPVTEDFSDFSVSAVLTYQPTDNVTAYGSVKRAYKPGGARAISTGVFTFDEENAWTYELGLKLTAFNERLRANSAVFYTDWSDLQVRARDPNAIASSVLNAAQAENYGVEFEAVALITDNFSIDLGAGYLESEFGDFTNAINESGELFDASGNRIQFSPRFSLNVGGQYDVAINSRLNAYLRAEYTYKGDQFGDVENTQRGTNFFNGLSGEYEITNRFVPSYGLVNLRAGVDFDDRISVSISAENLLDEFYITGSRASSISLAGNLDAVGQPRTVIGQISLKF